MEEGGDVVSFVMSDEAVDSRSAWGDGTDDGDDDDNVLVLVWVVTISTFTCAILGTGREADVLVIVTIPVAAFVGVVFMRFVVMCLSNIADDCFDDLSFINDGNDDKSDDFVTFRTLGISTNLFADDAIML